MRRRTRHPLRRPGGRAQGGVAILSAMLTVVLVASLASTVLWQQWRAVEVEAAERERIQSAWVLRGALDWARLILREDARKGGADHLAEPWAVPLEQARLSSFLAAERSDAIEADALQAAFLSGQIFDLQARLNVANLVQGGKVHEPSRAAFARLFELLGRPAGELDTLAENLRRAAPLVAGSPAPPAAVDDATAPLWPQQVAQLAWLGLSAPAIAVLRPYITLLPVPTPVNLNTAPAQVIYAAVAAFELADAHRLVRARNLTHLGALSEAGKAAGRPGAAFDAEQHSVASRFFEVRGSLRLNQTTVQEQSVLQREGLEVKTLWRTRGVLAANAPLQ